MLTRMIDNELNFVVLFNDIIIIFFVLSKITLRYRTEQNFVIYYIYKFKKQILNFNSSLFLVPYQIIHCWIPSQMVERSVRDQSVMKWERRNQHNFFNLWKKESKSMKNWCNLYFKLHWLITFRVKFKSKQMCNILT